MSRDFRQDLPKRLHKSPALARKQAILERVAAEASKSVRLGPGTAQTARHSPY